MDIDRQLEARTTRRTVVATGVKVAYAAPLVAASFRVTALESSAQVASPVGDACGCTPGFFGQNETKVDFNFSTTLASVGFNVAGSLTFDSVLNDSGGGNSTAEASVQLLFQAAAAFLNAKFQASCFAFSTSAVVSLTNTALAGGDRDAILALKDQFDAANNAGNSDICG